MLLNPIPLSQTVTPRTPPLERNLLYGRPLMQKAWTYYYLWIMIHKFNLSEKLSMVTRDWAHDPQHFGDRLTTDIHDEACPNIIFVGAAIEL